MASRELYMWEPTLSPHKLPLYRALQAESGFSRVVYVSDQPLSDDRAKQGWTSNLLPSDEIILSPSTERVREIVAQSRPDSVHVFSGLRNVTSIVEGFRACMSAGRAFGIMHEPRVFDTRMGLFRLAQSWLTEGALRRNAKFVLAIGAHGPQWFKMSGYRAASVFPFAYFIGASVVPIAKGSTDGRVRVGFLGRLERAKGLHLLFEAFDRLPPNYLLRIAGTGSLQAEAERFERAHPGRIEFRGKLDMANVTAFLDELDILVLASTTRDDGWGVVVSEALQRGLSVVVADPAGASACVSEPSVLGRRVTANSAQAITLAIEEIVSRGESVALARTERASWAERYLTATYGARYMNAVIEHVLSSAPSPGELLRDRPVLPYTISTSSEKATSTFVT